jgi:arginine N-succinyltransferase
MSLAFMRPVRREDFDAILALAKQSGGGMTNLPSDPDALRKRIDFAAASFEANATKPGPEVYTLALEKDGKLMGVSAVFSSVGLDNGFVNYRINRAVHVSRELGKRFEQRQLVLSYDFTGASEVGSLFLSPDARGGGYGKILARSRYLFIAQHRELVADPVCAEMRGWRGSNGEQPFWDAIGRKFFEMEFEEADSANASLGNQIISDLLPRHPIYVAMLPDDARKIMGVPHDNAQPAFKMLLGEGFAYNYYIDVFDGGPLVDAKVADIKTVKESRVYKAAVGEPGDAPLQLMGAGRLQTFRVTRCHGKIDGDVMTISADAAKALGVKAGDELRSVKW